MSNEGHFPSLQSAIDLRRGLRIYPAVLGRCQHRAFTSQVAFGVYPNRS
jgi:hypothetical protein